VTISFYFFLVGSLLAFLPAYWDHGKTLKEARSSKGNKRFQKQSKLFVLWAVPILGLFGTIFLGIEGVKDDRQYGDLTNSLQKVTVQYEQATNDLYLANKAAADATSAAANATSQAEKLKGQNAKLDEIDAKTQQRIITPENREQFVALLKDAPKGNVGIFIDANGGEEISTYANMIRDELGSAGYDTGRNLGISWGGKIHNGVFIELKNTNAIPTFFWPIHDALEAIGIKTTPAQNPDDRTLHENEVRIVVGRKP
jgi:hypothetical protein